TFVTLKRAIDRALLGEDHSAVKAVAQPKDVPRSLQQNTILPRVQMELSQVIDWTNALSIFVLAIAVFGLFSFYASRSKIAPARVRLNKRTAQSAFFNLRVLIGLLI